jgi:hypothetical protein
MQQIKKHIHTHVREGSQPLITYSYTYSELNLYPKIKYSVNIYVTISEA